MRSGRSAGCGRSSVDGGSSILSWNCRKIPGAGTHFALRWRSERLRKILEEWFKIVQIKVLKLYSPALLCYVNAVRHKYVAFGDRNTHVLLLLILRDL